MQDDAVTWSDIVQARERIRDEIYLTPCRKSTFLSQRTGATVFLKLDNLQMTGSFKERGACNRLMLLSTEERQRGVIAASAGNHAQAVAYHGARLGIGTKIVMPEGTPLIKVERTREYGAEIVLYGSSFDESYEHALELQAAEGRIFVHPFNDPGVIAGQGTLGLEVLEQVDELDAVLVAVGGGGLASGVCVAIKEKRPDVEIIGVEPEVLPSMKRAFQHGEVYEIPEARTLADGVAVRRVGELTFKLVRKYIDDLVTVTEHDIATTVLTLLEREKTVAEGAGALPLAALLSDAVELEGKRVCALICGGNIDVNVISRIIENGLVAAGRLTRLDLRLTDTPGELARVLKLLGDMNANVLDIFHNRTFTSGETFGTTNVELKVETRGHDHIAAIREALQANGFEIIERL
jgi:threonine dehydratase